MDVHKENIVTVSISGDSGTGMTRWETPNTAKGKERLAARIPHAFPQGSRQLQPVVRRPSISLAL
jgi:hypothetical protein